MAQNMLEMHMLGNNLSVYVNIWDKRKQEYKKGLLTFDTGASITTISKDILFALGYDLVDSTIQKITTASSVEYVREITIDKISLGGYELENVQVYAHTFPEESLTSGVIGLNVLSQFDVDMLFSKGQIFLTRF